MKTAKTLETLRKSVAGLRASGVGASATIGLVPTMGALHEGHLTLVRRAREECDHVVASIFVNPTQFGPNEDLDSYPRQLAEDSAMLEGEGCALLWAPDVEVMYPGGPANFATNVSVAGVSEGLCGADRPGHFDGVATVVLKLFNQVQPDMAFFGEKDFQQLAVIRTMAHNLDLTHPQATSIIGVPTKREADGLAMSSRNRYLSPTERETARLFPEALAKAADAIATGTAAIAAAKATSEETLRQAGFDVDYIAVVDAGNLKPIEQLTQAPARIIAAAKLGKTRLIDNMAVARQ